MATLLPEFMNLGMGDSAAINSVNWLIRPISKIVLPQGG